MNRTQHYSLLKAMEIDKNNLLKYQELYKYAYILSDGIFKIVFAEEKDHSLLISLVNAMLGLQGDDAIKDISLEMQEFPGVFNKKDCILDIIGTTNAGEKVLVEVQQQGDDFFRDRVEYYISRVIENQVHTSEKYELPRIYFLGLLDFEMFPEEPTSMKCVTVKNFSLKFRRFLLKSTSSSSLKRRESPQATIPRRRSGSVLSR